MAEGAALRAVRGCLAAFPGEARGERRARAASWLPAASWLRAEALGSGGSPAGSGGRPRGWRRNRMGLPCLARAPSAPDENAALGLSCDV